MEWFKKLLEQLKTLWSKWSRNQKIIFSGTAAALLILLTVMFGVSSSPTMVSVIDAPIRDENARDRIITRINMEGVKATVNGAGIIQVADEKTAMQIRNILFQEDLVPRGTDPWAIFDIDRWTLTDFDRNINKSRAINQAISNHIKALDDIDNAIVEINPPKERLFVSEQNPITASITLIPKPGSDIRENRKKIKVSKNWFNMQ